MAVITSSVTASDQEKYVNMKLLELAQYKCVMKAICDKSSMRTGNGKTAYMYRYKRFQLPTAQLTEGTTPTEFNTFELAEVTVTMEQFGDFVILSDVIGLTTLHPVFQIAAELLADEAARLMDLEIQKVMLAGTNRAYGDLTVTSRASVQSTMKATSPVIGTLTARLQRQGIPSWGKASFGTKESPASGGGIDGGAFLAICGPEVLKDIQEDSTFISVAQFSNAKALVDGVVGKWKGMQWVMTNFIPCYQILGNTTAAVTTANAFGTGTPVVTAVDGGGSLTSGATHYFVVTRKLKDAPFEDKISIEHSMAAAATGNNESFTFNFTGLSSDYVYNLYFGVASGDLRLHTANIASGTTVTVTAPVTGAAPPTPPHTSIVNALSLNPVYILSSQAIGWTDFYQFKSIIKRSDSDRSNTADPLNQRNTLGFKYFGKAVIKDQSRLLIWEVASSVGPVQV